jgi:hypothetical protein
MGGVFQVISLIPWALGILAALLLIAFLVGRLFQDKKTRRKIVVGAVVIYVLVVTTYVGFVAFILSGNIN